MAVDRTAGREVERRDCVGSRRRSGGRGQASGKRRRNGQPVDDIRVTDGEIALLEMQNAPRHGWPLNPKRGALGQSLQP
jgi:hypothetical protein